MRRINLMLGVLVLVSTGLSLASYQASELYTEAGAVAFSSSTELNPFLNLAEEKHRLLQFKADEMRARLDYMVFAKERTQAQQELMLVLRQQINGQPFSGYLWRDMVFTQEGLNITSASYLQSFQLAAGLLKWNSRERFLLLNRCVVESTRLFELAPKLCKELAINAPLRNDLALLSRRVGVDHDRLEAFFKRLGIGGQSIRNLGVESEDVSP